MPDFAQDDFSGALFRNEEKRHDKSPDYTGTATVDGVEYRMAAWINESRAGRKYMKIKFEMRDRTEPARPRASTTTELDDEIPF